MSALAIVGRGRVGTALARALADAGLDAELHAARALPAALGAPAYLLAVRDPAIADTARAVLARHAGPPPLLLHTAGALPSSLLREAGAASAAVLHPLAAFAGDTPPVLAGAIFAVEGDGPALALARSLATRVGATPLHVDAAQLARYHAAAVLASNHVLALVSLGQSLLTDLGADTAQAGRGLAALFGSVAANLSALGLPDALTGPVARGDVEAVRRHLHALADAPAARAAYLATIAPLVALARGKGVADPTALDRIAALVEQLYPPPVLD